MRPDIILLSGLPGTGKTATSEYLRQNISSYDGCSPESIRVMLGLDYYTPGQREQVRAKSIELTKNSLAKGRGMMIDAPFTDRISRQWTYELCLEQQRELLIIEHRCDESTALARLTSRGADLSAYGPIKVRSQPLEDDPAKFSWIQYNTDTFAITQVRIREPVLDGIEQIVQLLERR